ncbi:MAG: biosynthetic-type acetolactate synthase large subunit [Elusimicrobiota bacterium]
MNGARIVLECLKKEGVDIIFGIGGGVVIPILDELYDEKAITFILTRHEQAAAHMADGYARATGKVGVCLATSGPGATNLVTGLATAYMDSIPVVAITGQVATHLVGNDAFQEADTTGITRPVTKQNYMVTNIEDLAPTIKEAFHLARSGRPGPVLIDLPVDVQKSDIKFRYPEKIIMRGYNPKVQGHMNQIKLAAKAINSSKRPVLYVGGGIILSNASKELRKTAAKGKIPVTTTLMGVGSFPADDRLALGMLGMHGTFYANQAIQQSDLIIAVGARFDDRVTGRLCDFAKGARIIHIDIDPTSISKNVKADIPIVGDCKNVLSELVKLVELKERREWHSAINGWKKKHPLSYKKDDDKLRPQYVIEQLSRITGDDVVITTEVGQHQMWAMQFFKYNEPRTFLTSGGLGTMGYGFPAAIGAKFGKPDKTVICIAGDGSFQMNIQELATCVVNKIPVIVAILNNNYLGMVRQWQDLFYNKRYSQVCLGKSHNVRVPDFAKVATAYGAKGIRIEKKKDVEAAIRTALKCNGPVVMDFIVEKEENVYPMVPAGAAIDEILLEMA